MTPAIAATLPAFCGGITFNHRLINGSKKLSNLQIRGHSRDSIGIHRLTLLDQTSIFAWPSVSENKSFLGNNTGLASNNQGGSLPGDYDF